MSEIVDEFVTEYPTISDELANQTNVAEYPTKEVQVTTISATTITSQRFRDTLASLRGAFVPVIGKATCGGRNVVN